MTTIKIDRSTLRKNPNYGRPAIVNNNTEVSFIGYLPPDIEKNDLVCITERTYPIDGKYFYIGILLRPDDELISELNKLGAKITVENYVTECHSLYSPRYLFAYEPTKIECCNCKAMVIHTDIIISYMFDSDGEEHDADRCPVCGEIGTFQYEFENL